MVKAESEAPDTDKVTTPTTDTTVDELRQDAAAGAELFTDTVSVESSTLVDVRYHLLARALHHYTTT